MSEIVLLNKYEVRINGTKYLHKVCCLFYVKYLDKDPEIWSWNIYKGSEIGKTTKLAQEFAVWRQTNFHTSEIEYFTKVSSKAENDASNKIREYILAYILTHVPESHFTDSKYGTQWESLRRKWTDIIVSTYPDHTRFEVHHMAGRGHNYDFAIRYFKEDARVYEQKIEFKFNAKNLQNLPQILSLGCAPNILIPISYQEFYYDNFLPGYVKLDPEITVPIPERTEYLKYVANSKYDSHPFFRCLKERSKNCEEAKSKHVDISIESYIQLYGKDINIKEIMNILRTSQENKLFVLWFRGEFYKDSLSLTDEDIASTAIDILTKNTIVLNVANKYKLCLLLRWKNHKGVLYPAWQISVKAAKYVPKKSLIPEGKSEQVIESLS